MIEDMDDTSMTYCYDKYNQQMKDEEQKFMDNG
jgi:hypothetical protein